MRSLMPSTDLRVGYVPAVTVYHVHAQCNSVNCSVLWCGWYSHNVDDADDT
jgi:hypothetical protein